MKHLRGRMVRAIGWVLGSRIISQVISFGFGIALARLLVPDDFGLIAMALVFTGLAGLLSDVGLGSALVQKKDAREEHFSSVFWVNILIGCLLAVILFFVSPLLSTFYARPEIENICKILSLVFIVSSFALVPRTYFIKELAFKYLALSDLVAMILSGSVAVIMAVSGFGYWSLVIHLLGKQIISTAIVWRMSDWYPKSGINRAALGELFGFGASVLGTRLLQYVTNNIDKLLLGKYMGGEMLGLYDKAQSMMLFPLQNISGVIRTVMFPSLSLIQSETARVRNIYLRSTRAIALLTFPMMAGMFVVAESFVVGVLGPHWFDLIPVIKVLCFSGIASSIVTVTGTVYQSQGAAVVQLKVNLITQPLKILGVISGMPWGVIGVATGYTIATYINSVITLTIAGRLINLRLSSLISSLSPTLVPTLIMAFFVWIIRPISGLTNELILFLVQLLAGSVIYWACISTMKLIAYQDVKEVLLTEFVYKRNKKRSNQ